MTDQNNYMVEFEGERYFFETSTSVDLPGLTNIQVAPQSGTASSGSRRFLKFKIINKGLFLDELYVDIDRDVQAPVINGIKPVSMADDETQLPALYSHGYMNIDLPVRLTGGILLKTDFIGEFSAQMGFHPTWGARKVIELVFKDGTLVRKRDVSKLMADFRKRFIRVDATPGREETEKWGKDNFTLGYDFYSSLNGSELFEEDESEDKMKWLKFIALGVVACLGGFFLKETYLVRGSVKLTVMVGLMMLAGFGLINSGLLGIFASHKKITLKGN